MLETNRNAIKQAGISLVTLCVVLCMSAAAQESSSRASNHSNKQWWKGDLDPKQVVLYGFADVTDVAMLSDGPVKKTCSQALDPSASRSSSTGKPLTVEEQTQLADSVTEELAKGLERKIPVIYAQPPRMPSAGSLVITGCFVDTDRGSSAKRWAGAGLGASHLSAHVRIFYAGASGQVPVDEFDVAVKGSIKIPSAGIAGLAMNAFKEKRNTLDADAARLADEILKRLETMRSSDLPGVPL